MPSTLMHAQRHTKALSILDRCILAAVLRGSCRRASYEGPHALRCCHQNGASREQGIPHQQHGLPSKVVPQCASQCRAERRAEHCCADDDALNPIEAAAAAAALHAMQQRHAMLKAVFLPNQLLCIQEGASGSCELNSAAPQAADLCYGIGRDTAEPQWLELWTWKCCSGSSSASHL